MARATEPFSGLPAMLAFAVHQRCLLPGRAEDHLNGGLPDAKQGSLFGRDIEGNEVDIVLIAIPHVPPNLRYFARNYDKVR